MYGDKNNIRSFRYSDEVATALESAEGASLNEKFGNLVRKCYFDLPKREKELQSIQKQIDDKRNEYYALCEQLKQIDHLMQTLQSIKYYGEIAARMGKNIAEGRNEHGETPEEEAARRNQFQRRNTI